MDIHALPKLPWTYTYCILLLKRSDELVALVLQWQILNRWMSEGVIKSRITAHDTHRAEEPSAGKKKGWKDMNNMTNQSALKRQNLKGITWLLQFFSWAGWMN